MPIYAISDIHTDNRENFELLAGLSATAYQDDTLIIAGDISNSLKVLERTFELLTGRFKELFFVPGNHELWVSKEHEQSLMKFEQILSLCHDFGVCTRPKSIEDAWVVPLLSWYESAFYPAGDRHAKELEGWGDYHLCKWPDTAGFDPCQHFVALNQDRIRLYDRPVISFSHFVPRIDLIPPPNLLFFKSLPLVSGSVKIEQMIRSIGSSVHVFGHTHINVDQTIDGVRYVQNALRYPRERKMFGRPNRLNLVQVWPT